MAIDFDLLEKSWSRILAGHTPPGLAELLSAFVDTETRSGVEVLPPEEDVFRAFAATPFCDTRVVIIGQDPYPTPGHAHGLAFSVPREVRPLPRSLSNIFRELGNDLLIHRESGCLYPWAEQGVLLLNSVLTVAKGKPGSHAKRGWERFTDGVIDALNTHRQELVFVLWGSHAQQKGQAIDTSRHVVLKAPHPSPLSAYRGFFGSQPFSQINAHLTRQGTTPIDWQL